MDFGASTSGFEARLCHFFFYLFGIECCYSTKILATATHPTCFALGSNIPSVRRREQRFHFLQCRRSSPSFRFVNRSGGTLRRAGWVAFTKTYSRGKWLISHLPPTFAIIIHIPRPLRPCIWRPRVPASHTWCPQVPRLASPSPKSSHMRPDVPVPLSLSHFYTQPNFSVKGCQIFFRTSSPSSPFIWPFVPSPLLGWIFLCCQCGESTLHKLS